MAVDDSLDDPAGWHCSLDGIVEADELLVPVALHAAPDHRALKDVQRGKQCGGAISLVVMRQSLDSPLRNLRVWTDIRSPEW